MLQLSPTIRHMTRTQGDPTIVQTEGAVHQVSSHKNLGYILKIVLRSSLIFEIGYDHSLS